MIGLLFKKIGFILKIFLLLVILNLNLEKKILNLKLLIKTSKHTCDKLTEVN